MYEKDGLVIADATKPVKEAKYQLKVYVNDFNSPGSMMLYVTVIENNAPTISGNLN